MGRNPRSPFRVRKASSTNPHCLEQRQTPSGLSALKVGAQEIPAFPVAHGAQFRAVQGEGEGSFRRHGGLHQSGGDAAGAVAGGAEFLQALVAGNILLLDLTPALPIGLEFAPAQGAFLGGARAAVGQPIHLALRRRQFDAPVRTHFRPGLLHKLRFQFREPALGGAHPVADLGVRLAEFFEPGLGGDAPVHDPDALGLAVALWDERAPVPQSGFVGGVAGEHLVSQRQSLGRDDQRHDDWHAVAALVPAVAEAAGIGFLVRRVAFAVGAGQVVEEHVELGAEEIAPALAQMGEEGVLVCEQTVPAAGEGVVRGQAFIPAEPISAGGGAKPVPGPSPFAAGGEQTVESQEPEPLFPVGAFATDAPAGGEEGVELPLAPEWIAPPAGAPGAGAGELQRIQPDVNGGRGGDRRRAILGEERALAGRAVLCIEDGEGLLPGGLLGVIDLAPVEDVALPDVASDAAALDDRPGAMPLAVLLPLAALEKHAGQYSGCGGQRQGLGRPSPRLGNAKHEPPGQTRNRTPRKMSDHPSRSGSRARRDAISGEDVAAILARAYALDEFGFQ